jgi:hypothetical protein
LDLINKLNMMKYFNKRYIHVTPKIKDLVIPFSIMCPGGPTNLKNIISILDVNKKYAILFHLVTKNQLLSLGDRILFSSDFHFMGRRQN